ncbi:MAG TPA: sigma-70 family RNA polymerase sigma factor [Phytomonospora sp.]
MPLAPRIASVEELALAASLGDSDALAQLYDAYAPLLLARIESRCRGDHALAQDIASEVWEAVATQMRDYRPGRGGFPAWVNGITRNKTARYWRGHYRRREELTGDMLTLDAVSIADGADTLVERKQLAAQIAAEVEALPSRQRECVRYRFILGYDLAQTADAMGRNVNAIKQLQHRALDSLRKRLGPSIDALSLLPEGSARKPQSSRNVPIKPLPAGTLDAAPTS